MFQSERLDVFDLADDFPPLGLFLRSQVQSFSQGASAQIAFRQRLVNDGHARAAVAVLSVEVASGEQRNPQGGEIAGRYKPVIGIGYLVGFGQRAPFHVEICLAPKTSERKSVGGAGGQDTRQGSHPIENVPHERTLLIELLWRVAVRGQDPLHAEHMVRLKAQVGVKHAFEAFDQQSRARQ